MTIYKSTKVLPYAYIGIHRETGQFYIGSRTTKKLKLPPEQDLQKYRTSSKVVKPIFDEFDWYIVAMFFDPLDCYNFEQELIYNNIDDKLNLNRSCHHNSNHKFSTIGYRHNDATKKIISEIHSGKVMPDTIKEKIRKSSIGKIVSSETRKNISNSVSGKNHPFYGKSHSAETKYKIHVSTIGRNISDHAKTLISLANSKRYLIIDQDGIQFCVINLSLFCKYNNLNPSHMCSVASGKISQHKGFKCVKLL